MHAITKVLAETGLVKQTMTVENKPGGGGAVFMAEYATQERKNDYKLFVNSPPIIVNNLKAEGNSRFGFKDTKPLAQLTKDFGAIVVQVDSNIGWLMYVCTYKNPLFNSLGKVEQGTYNSRESSASMSPLHFRCSTYFRLVPALN